MALTLDADGKIPADPAIAGGHIPADKATAGLAEDEILSPFDDVLATQAASINLE